MASGLSYRDIADMNLLFAVVLGSISGLRDRQQSARSGSSAGAGLIDRLSTWLGTVRLPSRDSISSNELAAGSTPCITSSESKNSGVHSPDAAYD